MSADCIFCKIIDGKIPATKVYEDEAILAFKDIHPKASTHLLVIPKEHIENLNYLTEKHTVLMGRLLSTIPQVAKENGLSDYRIIANNGSGSGQIVFHLHFHLLGGKSIPPF